MSDLGIQFEQSAKHIVNLAYQPSNAEKLRLYALYKQATLGDNHTAKPGLFDIVGAAKWRAWLDLAGMPSETATQQYVDLVAQLEARSPKAVPSAPISAKPPASTPIKISSSANWATLDACLRARAAEFVDNEVFAFLDANGERVDQLSYAELHERACRVAAAIQAHGSKGQRVLLLFEPGLHFAVAFYGCLYAGAIAVPAYPPDPRRFERTLPRLQTIAADSSPSIVLTSAPIMALAKELLSVAPDLARLEWLSIDEILTHCDTPAHDFPAQLPNDIAFIQYTSGSTSSPKGVMVTHGNVMINARMMQRVAKQDSGRIVVSWLPLYHDLGLMSGIILPVVMGARSLLMSPLDFLKRPALWLSSIQRYQATDTSAPNFALDLCVQKISADERNALDLSSLKMCLIGAEPVRHDSVERFLRTFERHGLSLQCMHPGYGLAEAVVGVSCASIDRSWRTAVVDAEQLALNRVVDLDQADPRALPLVSCGDPIEEMIVKIVHPETREPVDDDEVGEIWITGPHVAMGYWQREADTVHTFKARLAKGDERDWLRTGDMGFMKDGELYPTGRIKDVIIVRGKNYYPQDIERTVESSHPRIRHGCVIAFGVEQGGSEGLVLVAEIDARHLPSEQQKQEAFQAIVASLATALNAVHGLAVHAVVLLKAKTIDKTSSGKLARQACRQRYLSSTLDTEFAWHRDHAVRDGMPSEQVIEPTQPMENLHRMPPVEQRRYLLDYLAKEIARLGGHAVAMSMNADSRLDEIGMDSLATMELIGRLERTLQVKIPVTQFLTVATLGALTDAVLELMESSDVLSNNGTERIDGRNSSVRMRGDIPTTARPMANARPRLTQAVALRALSIPAPVFCVGGLGGTVLYLSQLSEALGDARPLIAFQSVGIDGAEPPLGSVEEMAQRYLQEIKAIQPQGPYVLAGHSFGGLVAYEMACRLVERGDEVEHVFLIDTTTIDDSDQSTGVDESISEQTMAMYEIVNISRRVNSQDTAKDLWEQLASMDDAEQQQRLLRELGADASTQEGSVLHHVTAAYVASFSAMRRYRPAHYAGAVTLFRARGGFPKESSHPARKLGAHFDERSMGWQRLCPALQVVDLDGDHFTVAIGRHAAGLADAMMRALKRSARIGIGLDRLPATKPFGTAGRAIEITPEGVRFDPFHPAMVDDPYPILRQLRERAPVYQDVTSAWWLTRYADVSAGLRDKRLSVDTRNVEDRDQSLDIGGDGVKPSLSSAWFRQQEQLPLARLYNNFMLLLDPPRHHQIRRLFAPLFDPPTMKRLKKGIEGRVNDLVADMRLRRDPDVIRDLALPLPVSVISEMLGTPQQDAFVLQSWAHEIFRGFDPMLSGDAAQRIDTAARDFVQYMSEHIDRRRRSPPKDDLLELLFKTNEGQSLSTDELVANCILLFTAGFETTTSVVGNAVLALLRHPDQMRVLREHPELAESQVDEFLRYEGALRLVNRIALEDLEIGGKLIKRGDYVMFVLSAANRDPEAFPDPDRLDLTRNAKHQLGFSHGAHYCLGAPLARMEIASALSALARHDFRLVPGSVRWRESVVFRSLDQLRITFH